MSALLVLVITADEGIRDTLRDIVEEYADCRVAATAGEALAQAMAPPGARLVVLDARLAGPGGWDLVRQLRQEGLPSSVPLLLLTGGEPGAEAEAFAQGAADCLVRPIDPAIARARLRTHIELVRHRLSFEEHAQERIAQLRDAVLAAESDSHAKSMFIDNLTHELRTPLNGILGMARLLLEQHPEGKQKEHLEILRKSSETLLALINDLLDFAKLEKQELRLAPIRFNVRELLAALVARFAPDASAKGVRLESLVEAAVPALVFGDLQRLHQILAHLLDNGIKFSSRGGSVTVAASLREAPKEGPLLLEFCVIDTGIGIAPEKRLRIFRSFTQADGSHTRRHSGVGQGLALTASLVKLLGGEIWFESEPGQGTSFHVLLPFSLPAPPAV